MSDLVLGRARPRARLGRLLVLFTGSTADERALDTALQLAECSGASLQAVFLQGEFRGYSVIPGELQRLKQAWQARLAEQAFALCERALTAGTRLPLELVEWKRPELAERLDQRRPLRAGRGRRPAPPAPPSDADSTRRAGAPQHHLSDRRREVSVGPTSFGRGTDSAVELRYERSSSRLAAPEHCKPVLPRATTSRRREVQTSGNARPAVRAKVLQNGQNGPTSGNRRERRC